MHSPYISEIISIDNNDSGRNVEILELYGVQYKSEGNYLHVGETTPKDFWVLIISVIRCQITNLLKDIIPLLVFENAGFKIAQDKKTAGDILDGHYGNSELGKVVCIYPENEIHAIELSKQLILRTGSYKGPSVPGAFHLGGCIYTVYSGFPAQNKTNADSVFCLPRGISWPFSEIKSYHKTKKKKFLDERYLPIMIMKSDVKGKVFKCINFKNLLNPTWCLIKQGKSNMFSDDFGRDIQDKLSWQQKLSAELTGKINMPAISEVFFENGDLYLVMEFIEGQTLNDLLDRFYKNNNSVSVKDKIILTDHLISICDGLMIMHQNGIIHRDLNPENFLINKSGKLYFIDLEFAYRLQSDRSNPPLSGGTPGFMSPEQWANEIPTIEQDIFGLGVLIACSLTGLPPQGLSFNDLNETEKKLSRTINGESMVSILISCLDSEPHHRPGIETIIRKLIIYRNYLINVS